MSTRHSFLSTTGLLRPASSLSNLSIAEEEEVSIPYYQHAQSGDTKPGRKQTDTVETRTPQTTNALTTKAGIRPLGSMFLVTMGVFLSILYIVVMMCAFIRDEDEKPVFASVLDDVAANTPGVSTPSLWK